MSEPQIARTVRLYVEEALAAGGTVGLGGEQTHYVRNVMRTQSGDMLALFNGIDGEWRARIARLGRDQTTCQVEARMRPQRGDGDAWLVFAPIKRARTNLIAEKATELGAARLIPVVTERTQSARVNTARLRAHAIEAAQQCGRLTVPKVAEPETLAALTQAWPTGRHLLVCTPGAPPPAALTAPDTTASWAVLIGPEGGLTQGELDGLSQLQFVSRVGLGPRILRAETAAVAALAVMQSLAGDWRA